MRAMILAAGRGERLKPLTDQLPKPMLEAGGKPLLQWHLENLCRAGFREVVINLAYLGEKIQAFAGNGKRWGINIHYSQEPDGGLETGGGILKALPLLGKTPFLVINGDIWSDYPLHKLRNHHCSGAHLVMVKNPPHHPDGDFSISNGLVYDGDNTALTFSGIGIYHPVLFSKQESSYFRLAPLLRQAMQTKTVSGEKYNGRWFDIGSEERLNLLRKILDSEQKQL